MRRGTVQVQVSSILPVSNSSYTVQWTEFARDLRGTQTASETWEATVGVAFNPPKDEATIMVNPLGLYITSLNWTKKL